MFLRDRRHEVTAARQWFLLALIFGVLFLGMTALYAAGVLTLPTLLVERWLIGRPLTQFDCVLVEWRNLGAVPVNLVFIALLGVTCGLTRYRWRVLPALIALVLIGLVAEVVGKKFFALPLPSDMQSAMTTLTCPQAGSSPLLHLQLWLGMAWQAPLPQRGVHDWAHTVSQLPINLGSGQVEQNYSYPSGHAIRWWFTGLLLAWLFWHHAGHGRYARRGIVRKLCVALILALSFTGAALQFYVGTHLIADTLAGYLLGTALACFAIGLLILNEKKRELKDYELLHTHPATEREAITRASPVP